MAYKELDPGNSHSGVDDALLESTSFGMSIIFIPFSASVFLSI